MSIKKLLVQRKMYNNLIYEEIRKYLSRMQVFLRVHQMDEEEKIMKAQYAGNIAI